MTATVMACLAQATVVGGPVAGRRTGAVGAGTADRVAGAMLESMVRGDFNTLYTDNSVPRKIDAKRNTWAADDIIPQPTCTVTIASSPP